MEYSNKISAYTEEIKEESNTSFNENNIYQNTMINEKQESSSLPWNMETSGEEFNTCVTDILGNADYQKLATDMNYVKDIFTQLLPTNLSNEGKSILLLYILKGYSSCIDIKLVATEVRGYLNKSCLTLLAHLDFIYVFRNTSLLQLFNDVLRIYCISNNELFVNMLYESLTRIKGIPGFKKNISFFQVFTVGELYKAKLYKHITQLIESFNIDEFDIITNNELIKNELFSYFHKLAYSLILSNNYERSYKILTITLLLNFNSVQVTEFQNMLAELVFLSLVLNIKSSNPNLVIVKYKSKMPSKLLNVFQSYQAADFESFVYNCHLYILSLQSKNNIHLTKIYNKESLIYLAHQILQNKFQFLSRKTSRGIVMKRLDEVNHKIVVLNRIFNSYDMSIPPFEFQYSSNKNINSAMDILVNDVKRVININRSMNDI